MKLLLMGPPASGKGTIGQMLSEKFGIPLISGGALLRNLNETHPRYAEIREILARGDLAPQEFLADLYKERIVETDCVTGYIIDGWGRKMIDLELFDPGFDYVLVFNISRDTALKRISGRRICTSDGQFYNIYTLPESELAKCTGELVQREDDKEEVVNHRLDLYEQDTQPVIEYLRLRNKVVEVNAEPLPDVIFNEVVKALSIND